MKLYVLARAQFALQKPLVVVFLTSFSSETANQFSFAATLATLLSVFSGSLYYERTKYFRKNTNLRKAVLTLAKFTGTIYILVVSVFVASVLGVSLGYGLLIIAVSLLEFYQHEAMRTCIYTKKFKEWSAISLGSTIVYFLFCSVAYISSTLLAASLVLFLALIFLLCTTAPSSLLRPKLWRHYFLHCAKRRTDLLYPLIQKGANESDKLVLGLLGVDLLWLYFLIARVTRVIQVLYDVFIFSRKRFVFFEGRPDNIHSTIYREFKYDGVFYISSGLICAFSIVSIYYLNKWWTFSPSLESITNIPTFLALVVTLTLSAVVITSSQKWNELVFWFGKRGVLFRIQSIVVVVQFVLYVLAAFLCSESAYMVGVSLVVLATLVFRYLLMKYVYCRFHALR